MLLKTDSKTKSGDSVFHKLVLRCSPLVYVKNVILLCCRPCSTTDIYIILHVLYKNPFDYELVQKIFIYFFMFVKKIICEAVVLFDSVKFFLKLN